MNTVTVSLPLSKKELLARLDTAISEKKVNEAAEIVRIGYTDWMLPPDRGPVFLLGDLLKFPKELLIQSVVEQMCYHGECRSFSKFWKLVESCQEQPWVYELVMLVYANLPYEANPQRVRTQIRELLGYIPDNLVVDNRAKCWIYLDKHPCTPEQRRELRHKYSNLLHNNKNRNLLSLLA